MPNVVILSPAKDKRANIIKSLVNKCMHIIQSKNTTVLDGRVPFD